ncbi:MULTISPECIES: ImmA/IrrE family metallo-endopeptidase [Rhizobium]|uniref:ImmA/IrrE family metallo-endopeptidase n=1 Tax=Rhizobium TaxID=379 RepID=UPI001C927378|nr:MULTISPECIES: hypothetical protein [Rhizobium]MBY3081847.1 ImmA/IrrE family metallo-endopeptidase [Rhizobium laguerreae]MBY3271386.1 ImmA/IrrE family metallo-endopeptidase [Rhizobium laguerreae]MBY3294475.1 ImmA/IrrE family metallo-endopeptidase [Rhizobium laguerreae]MBY3327347.1 ImmA/IrrE family metallo-endopeptidase [Rhizobium laguerreae]MBY3543523.1 ImmA/IrrE family metallo-endopeptidase [Rhizobium laguerreae]
MPEQAIVAIPTGKAERDAGRLKLIFVALFLVLSAGLVATVALKTEPGLERSKLKRLAGLREAARLSAAEQLSGLDNYVFLVPKVVIPVRTGFTVGELTDVLEKNIGENAETLTDQYAFRDFVLFLGSSFAISPGGPFRSVTFNSDPGPKTLSIWFIDPLKLDDPRQLANSTCTYLGFADIVVCNAALVRAALEDISKISRSQSLALNYCDGECPNSFRVDLLGNLDDLHSLMRQNFLIWLIGHEIGHALKHRDWAINSQQPLHFLGRYDPREAEADQFVGETVDRVPALKASFAPLLLEYVDQRFLALYREREGSLDMVVPAQNQPERPLQLDRDPQAMLLMRALGMITTIVESDPEALGQIYLRPIGSDLGFVNSFKSPDYVTFLNSKVLWRGVISSSIFMIEWYVVLLMAVSAAGCFLVIRSRRSSK